jgi:hypothetical protein
MWRETKVIASGALETRKRISCTCRSSSLLPVHRSMAASMPARSDQSGMEEEEDLADAT